MLMARKAVAEWLAQRMEVLNVWILSAVVCFISHRSSTKDNLHVNKTHIIFAVFDVNYKSCRPVGNCIVSSIHLFSFLTSLKSRSSPVPSNHIQPITSHIHSWNWSFYVKISRSTFSDFGPRRLGLTGAGWGGVTQATWWLTGLTTQRWQQTDHATHTFN